MKMRTIMALSLIAGASVHAAAPALRSSFQSDAMKWAKGHTPVSGLKLHILNKLDIPVQIDATSIQQKPKMETLHKSHHHDLNTKSTAAITTETITFTVAGKSAQLPAKNKRSNMVYVYHVIDRAPGGMAVYSYDKDGNELQTMIR